MKIRETHKIGPDGRRLDGVASDPATIYDLRSYDGAKHLLGSMRVPVLLHANDPHERLFVANFDGTGNDAEGDPNHMTNVGRFAEQLKSSHDHRVSSYYVAGPGTQWDFARRIVDGAIGYSHDQRVQIMYDRLSAKADEWLVEDPQARIRLITTGFSRGGEETMSLSRKVHEEGVVVTSARKRRQLIAPGSVPQAVALFDPVATGHPSRHDRRLPPSVVAAVQLVAKDERRSQFPASMIIPPGLSSDRRLLSLTVPGAHSDVGGSYHEDGLSRVNGNLVISFFNGLVEPDLLTPYQLYDDIRMYGKHRSQDHSILYDTRVHDRLGARGVRGAQEGGPDCRPVTQCELPEPVSAEVLAQVPDVARVEVGQVPSDVIDLDRHFAPELELQARILGGSDTSESADRARDSVESRNPLPEPRGEGIFNAEGHIDPHQDNRIEFTRFPRLEPQAAIDHDPDGPTHPAHRDHALYNSLHEKLTTLHAEEGIKLSDEQMDRLAHCAVATAKGCRMGEVSHVSLGQDREGNVLPEVHLYEAFRGELDDPRTKWGKVEALAAFQTPVETASRTLQVANQQIDQFQQDQQVRMAQQQEQGMSMSR